MLISPKTDCTHISMINFYPIEKFIYLDFEEFKCEYCNEKKELWICLTCAKSYCSRYINKHFINHSKENNNHIIGLSMLDLSVWCYKCKTEGFLDLGSYIYSSITNKYVIAYSDFKFGKNLMPKPNKIAKYIKINNKQCQSFKYYNFIELLKNNKFKNGVLMVGAGISTSAGIPDFRSEKGLFKEIKERYKVKNPEEFFSKKKFIEKPNLLYDIIKKLDFKKYNPTITHYFMKYLVDKGIINIIFTQNIDGLELKAGIEHNKIIFAHGSLNGGECINCGKKINIEEINILMNKGEVKFCPECNFPCKPSIVLYGEDLSINFYETMEKISKCDLGIVIGTSLSVEPFSSLPEKLNENCWSVVINNEEVGEFDYLNLMKCNLFLKGNCDEIIKKILVDCNWWDDFFNMFYNNKIIYNNIINHEINNNLNDEIINHGCSNNYFGFNNENNYFFGNSNFK